MNVRVHHRSIGVPINRLFNNFFTKTEICQFVVCLGLDFCFDELQCRWKISINCIKKLKAFCQFYGTPVPSSPPSCWTSRKRELKVWGWLVAADNKLKADSISNAFFENTAARCTPLFPYFLWTIFNDKIFYLSSSFRALPWALIL